MSRKFALLAAACAFTALVGAGSPAHAQAQSDMVAPGSGVPGGSSAPMATSPMGGSHSMGSHHGMRGHHGAMRQERRAERRSERRQMRADRRAAQNPDAAYMGGGGVYERAPDGSLRPVM